jgi:uncharacterized protein (TIGR01244 family)
MSTQDIYNYHFVNDQLITGGQPTEGQIKSAAADGFKVVINLATFHPQHSLPDEAGLVRSLGMAYYHIPVEWTDPQESDFDTFEQVFKQATNEKTLLHCAANFRATAFYSLYAMKHLEWSEEQADKFRASVWRGSNDPIWKKFIREMQARFNRQ